jgi:hypothetical protein
LYQQFGEEAFVASAQQAELLETENTNLHKQLERLKAQEIIFERLLGKMTFENHRLREQINTPIYGKANSRIV